MRSSMPVLLLAVSLVSAACSGGEKAPAQEAAAPADGGAATPAPSAAPAAEAGPPVTAVSACTVLTAEEVAAVYTGKTFAVESRRDDTPNMYEALSACRYSEGGSTDPMVHHVELTVRAKATPADAMKVLTDHREMDPDKIGRPVSGVGDAAVYYGRSMANNGPSLDFVRGNVYYELNLQSIGPKAGADAEAKFTALSRAVLAAP